LDARDRALFGFIPAKNGQTSSRAAVGESIRVSIDESFRRLEAVRSRIWRAECHYRHAETL